MARYPSFLNTQHKIKYSTNVHLAFYQVKSAFKSTVRFPTFQLVKKSFVRMT